VSSSCIGFCLSHVSSSSGFIIPREFNSDRKKKGDNISKTKGKKTKRFQVANEAAIAYFACVDAVAAKEAAAIESAAVEVAAIEAVDIAFEEPTDHAYAALVIGIADHYSRPHLPDFVPPPISRRVLYRPHYRWRSPTKWSPTPPGEPESEVEDFIPDLSDFEVRSEVGHSSEDEAPELTVPPPPAPTSPLRRVVRIRKTKTNKTRCVVLDKLFRSEPQGRIARRKLDGSRDLRSPGKFG
jgi:hypothetical protein